MCNWISSGFNVSQLTGKMEKSTEHWRIGSWLDNLKDLAVNFPRVFIEANSYVYSLEKDGILHEGFSFDI